ncbi:unnamed protein product, partial [Discosporangium mesarthrocarpum]
WDISETPILSFKDLEEGLHNLTVRAKRLGYDGSHDQVPDAMNWEVDTVCPDTNFVVLPDVVTHLMTAVLVVKGSDDTVGFQYLLDSKENAGSSGEVLEPRGLEDEWLDGGVSGVIHLSNLAVSDRRGMGWEGGGVPVGVLWWAMPTCLMCFGSDLEEGRHEVRVRAVDAAGNTDPSPATYGWIVDRAGVYGHPSMVTDVVADGGNQQAYVSWSPPSDDGGGGITKYVVVATTDYTDINVEVITTVRAPNTAEDTNGGAGVGEPPPTDVVVTGLTNGLVYSFQVVVVNPFGYGPHSLPSNKVLMFDPADPCGLVTCGDHGSCFVRRSRTNALQGFCVCRPG